MFDAADFSTLFDSDMPGYADMTLPGGLVVGGLFRDDFADGFGMSGTRPSMLVPPGGVINEGDAVTIGGQAYVVTESRPEGARGLRRLILNEAD